MEEKKELIESKEFNTALTKINEIYMPMIERQFTGNHMNFNEYQKRCVMSAISSINTVLDEKNIKWNDPLLDQSNVGLILFNVACLELNSMATPREVYFQIRNVAKKIKEKDKDGNEKERTIWIKKIEMGIEGDGNDALLARFGRNVKKVMPYWLVREGDEFVYPKYKGLELTPPEWNPTGQGEVVRIVYPIIDNNDIIHYYIGERSDVRKNLVAHIKNNLMNETFGICKDRYSATPTQLKQIADKKKEIMAKVKELDLDGILDSEELEPYISPSWKEDQSRESMIIRKIRNNITKPIPKDFGSNIIQEAFQMMTDESYRELHEVIEVQNGTEPVAIELSDEETGEVIEEVKTEPAKEPAKAALDSPGF